MSQSIGERLKSAREAKGTTLEEACKATKIQKVILLSIEGDRLHEQIDPAYAKIFLKKYAAYLGLDGSAVSKEFVSIHGPIPDRPISLQTEATRKAQEAQGPVGLLRVLLVLTAGVSAVAVVAMLMYLAAGWYADFSKKQKFKSARIVSAQKKEGPSVERAPAAPKLIVPKSQPLKLTIKAKADVWMQVKSDGSVIFQNVLTKGSQENWTAKDELELWTGNAGAMVIHLNGRPLEGLGSGVKKGIRITHEGLKGSR